MPGHSNFALPTDYVRFAELLSANAQMYLQCTKCEWEQRINLLYGFPGSQLLTEPCSQCGSTEHCVVRHVDSYHGRCLDCGHDLAGLKTVPWVELACPNCGSHRLDIQNVEVTPPYPSKFGEAGDRTPLGWEGDNYMRKQQPWGTDAASDAGHLQREARKAVHFHPADSSGYMLCEFLFGESLLISNEYEDGDENLGVFISMLASLMRDCFRQLGDLPTGLKALQLDEMAVTIEKEPANKAGWEHNVAIVINSLLVRYPEQLIAEATGRPEIRKEAVEYAERALRFYKDESTKDADRTSSQSEATDTKEEEEQEPKGYLTSSNQVARTYHLIGDLRRIGDATDEERRNALEAYDEALKWGLPENLVPGLQQSRGETILMLPDATPEELATAWVDLEAALNADTTRLGRGVPWAGLWHMAQVAERLDDRAVELEMLEKAARVAMAVVGQNREEYALEARSAQMAPLFDSLAHRYAAMGKAAEALSAAEALRAATVRLHTKTKETQSEDFLKMLKQAGADLARAHLRQAGHEVSLVESLLSDEDARIDSIEPAVERLLEADAATRTAIVSFSNPVWKDGRYAVVAFVCGAKSGIQCQLLHPDFEDAQWSPELIRPGPFRETRLRHMHQAIADGLVTPLLPILGAIGAQRIVFSLPGVLSRYAFEAASLSDGEGTVLVQRWEVVYVPALALALDKTKQVSTPAPKLLVVGYQGDDLTNAAHEVERLRELFGKRMTLISGKTCTKVNVLKHLVKPFDYIHFVCHGTFDPEMPLQAALHFVPDVQDDSQRLTAADIFANVKFPKHPLITMSACSTALMSSSSVNNCHGLAGGFLRAGARGVVGSRWPVYDATSALFMSALYEKVLSGESASPAACVTAVQREFARDRGIEDFASFGYMGIP